MLISTFFRTAKQWNVNGEAIPTLRVLKAVQKKEPALRKNIISEDDFDHLFFVKPPFGPYPLELMETYPVGQAEIPVEIDEEAKTVALQNTLKLLKINEGKAKFFFSYDNIWKDHPLIEEIKKYAEVEVEVKQT